MDIEKMIKDYAAEKGFIAGLCTHGGENIVVVGVGCEPIIAPPIKPCAKSVQDFCVSARFNRGSNVCYLLSVTPNKGRLATFAAGVDYHITVRKVLEGLRGFLYDKGFRFESRIQVDGGPLPERFLALKAGLGWLGKNQCVISEKFGSFFNIGCLVLSYDIKVDTRVADVSTKCEHCGRCINACPTNALYEGGYEVAECISFITQKKGELSAWEQAAIGGWLYGCDICQTACPHNAGQKINETYVCLNTVLAMTKAEFKQKYEHTALYWRGLKTLQRNAAAVLNNLTTNA